MKILLFTENYYRGGLDTFLISLINSWPHEGDQLALICNASHPGLAQMASKLKRPCAIIPYRLPGHSDWSRARRTKGFWASDLGQRFASAIRKMLAYPLFVIDLIALTRRFRRDEYDRLLVVNGGYPGGMTCRAASIAWNLAGRKPLAIHNFHNLAVPVPYWRRLIENLIDSAVRRSSRMMVSVSACSVESIFVRSAFRKGGSYKVINNGIEAIDRLPRADFSIRQELGISTEAPLCLMLCTYEPRKGHEFFLKAFRQVVDRLPDAAALICGHGSEAEIERVRKLVTSFDLSGHVFLQGHRSDADQLLADSQVLVVASQAYESFGLVIVEAMAMKVPVVATRIGGVPEVMPNGIGGLLCDPDNSSSFADSILAILENKDLADKLRQLGFDRYQLKFTASRMAAEYALLVRQEDASTPNR